eukprot:gene4684-6579_t
MLRSIFPLLLLLLDYYIYGFPTSHQQIISHRGASGYVPEHSLPAYQLAIDLLSNYIEPDLCLSKDGVFVAMHDLLLDDTTNVASIPQFQDKYTTKVVDGSAMTGYFVNDFTLSELKLLTLKQRLSGRTTVYDGLFYIPTLDEIVSLVKSYPNSNRTVGIYMELKHPSYFNDLGFQMEDMLLENLERLGYDAYLGNKILNKSFTDLTSVVPIIIECFETPSLQYLKTITSFPLIQLMNKQPTDYWTSETLQFLSTFSTGIGPDKNSFANMSYESAKSIINKIHYHNLKIHPWTFRADNGIMQQFNNNFAEEELYFYCCLGVDALFTEFPDRTRETLNLLSNFTLITSESNPIGINNISYLSYFTHIPNINSGPVWHSANVKT